ncbi:DUF6082 family protein [Streptomonospora arabica]|uniref:DUF6082 family protein n=1 Tax=Streptomonospora arabica TaxID=412417 RepID=A0ABV9STA0_9ACTN
MRVLAPVVVALLAVVVVGLVVLSPLGLGAVEGVSDDWEDLSFIGQTYGAASALLAGLALLGVVATLVLQARETRMSRELALRDSNSELLRMAMEDAEYARCWGANLPMPDRAEQRRSMYTNMIVSQWEMAYDSRAMGDEHVRVLARGLFAGRIGWEFWNRVRAVRLRTAESRRSRRFHRILDEEFRASAEPPPDDDGDSGDDGGRERAGRRAERRSRGRAGGRGRTRRGVRALVGAVAAGGVAAGSVVAGVLLARRRRRRVGGACGERFGGRAGSSRVTTPRFRRTRRRGS